ncbi:hypothetical protein RZN25_01020 [Bacillaceae bacterium S4-13-56]
MEVAKTLSHKITNHSRIFDETLFIYNEALSFIIDIIDKEFDNLDEITVKNIHTTKSNPSPKYIEFNLRFYKFPSYFRRSAIASAFGKVKSYRSNYQKWLKEKESVLYEGKKFKKNPPAL